MTTLSAENARSRGDLRTRAKTPFAPPSISIVIPTKNRSGELSRAVQSVLAATVLPIEIIVIDQSEDDQSKHEVERIFPDLPERARNSVELVYIHDPEINGLTAARNRAMEVARGDIWLFIDDDMVPEPDFIENLIAAYKSKPDAAGISGIVTNYSPPDSVYRRWSAVFARGPFFDERQPIYWNADRLRDTGPIKVRKLGGGMMSFRPAAIKGMTFDPNLTGGSLAEDADFTVRLSQAGASLYIAPSARIEHRHSGVGRAGDHWLRAHAQSSYYLYYRHWRKGFRNRICFAWLNLGYVVAASLACVKRRSSGPFKSLSTGVRRAREIAFGKTKPASGELA